MNSQDSHHFQEVEDEIEIIDLIRPLWHRWRMILFGTLAVTLLAFLVSIVLPKVFLSEGFYQLASPELDRIELDRIEKGKDVHIIGIPIPLYKQSYPFFINPNHLISSINQENDFILEEFSTKRPSGKEISKWIDPVYAYAKEDAKEFVQTGTEKTNSVIGLNLSYKSDTPEKAQYAVNFLGQYIRNSLFYISLYEYIMKNLTSVDSELNQNENSVINLGYNILSNKKKLADIGMIMTRYPDSAEFENRQLVSIQDKGYLYLSPVTQQVGIESVMAEQRQKIDLLEIENEELLIYQEYFSNCKNELDTMQKNGEVVFAKLKLIKEKVFSDKDFTNLIVKKAANNLKTDLDNFELAFFHNCRFISGPIFPQRPIAPQPRKIVMIAFFLSGIFFVLLAFSLHWWENNRQAI